MIFLSLLLESSVLTLGFISALEESCEEALAFFETGFPGPCELSDGFGGLTATSGAPDTTGRRPGLR